MKTCTKCGERKPLDQFHKRTASRDGLQPLCRECHNAAHKAWEAKSPDKARAKRDKWATENPDKVAAANKRWRAENSDKVRAHASKYRAAQTQATPPWADSAAIAAIYAEQQEYINLGVDCHVDHIVPLRGKNVCGLHVHNNLRVILAEDNLRKGNKHRVSVT